MRPARTSRSVRHGRSVVGSPDRGKSLARFETNGTGVLPPFESVGTAAEMARRFLRLADLPNFALDGLNRSVYLAASRSNIVRAQHA